MNNRRIVVEIVQCHVIRDCMSCETRILKNIVDSNGGTKGSPPCHTQRHVTKFKTNKMMISSFEDDKKL